MLITNGKKKFSLAAAAVAKQYGVVASNVASFLKGEKLEKQYDGYTGCPIFTGDGTPLRLHYIYLSIFMHIYIYIEREREREKY